jgi:hypothetical protein
VPRDLTDWVVGAAGSWVVGVDNLSRIEPWLSDAFCRTSTGEGLVRRRLHTDSELAVVALRRCIVLTSISGDDALRGDLADRLVVAQLERLDPSERRTERELATLLIEWGPELLGGLLTLAGQVLAALPHVETPELPRLASYGQVVAALDHVTGSEGLEQLAGLEQRLAADVLEGDELALAILHEIDQPLGDGRLAGTAAEILARLTSEKPSRTWPRTPRAFSGRLRRLAPALRMRGVSVYFERQGHTKRRVIEIQLAPGTPSAPSVPSETAWLSGKSADGNADGSADASFLPSAIADGADGTDSQPSALFPLNHAPADGADGADDVITSDLEEVERGSLAWLGRARPDEIAAWADERERDEAP